MEGIFIPASYLYYQIQNENDLVINEYELSQYIGHQMQWSSNDDALFINEFWLLRLFFYLHLGSFQF